MSYSFAGWTGSGTGSYSGTNNPASITMNGPITENAAFTQNPVQVTVQTNPAGRSFTVDGTTEGVHRTPVLGTYFCPLAYLRHFTGIQYTRCRPAA